MVAHCFFALSSLDDKSEHDVFRFFSDRLSEEKKYLAKETRLQARVRGTDGIFKLRRDEDPQVVVVVWIRRSTRDGHDAVLAIACEPKENAVAALNVLAVLPAALESAKEAFLRRQNREVALQREMEQSSGKKGLWLFWWPEAVEMAVHFFIPDGMIQVLTPDSVAQLLCEMTEIGD